MHVLSLLPIHFSEGQSNKVEARKEMELRCPGCGSSNLKKLTLVYQEGLSRAESRSRFRGFMFADDGIDLIVGGATTKKIQQTRLSKNLGPPRKWSYLKLLCWWVVVCFVILGGYVRSIMLGPPNVSTLQALPLVLILFLALFVVVFVIWLHNRLAYPRELARWNHSYLCQCCGLVHLWIS